VATARFSRCNTGTAGAGPDERLGRPKNDGERRSTAVTPAAMERASFQRAEGTLSAHMTASLEELPGIHTPSPRARHRPENPRSPARTLAAQTRLVSRGGRISPARR